MRRHFGMIGLGYAAAALAAVSIQPADLNAMEAVIKGDGTPPSRRRQRKAVSDPTPSDPSVSRQHRRWLERQARKATQ